MPILKGKSKKIIASNIKELSTSAPGGAREKGIHTMMKTHGMDYATAKNKMAIAIAFSKAGKSKK